MKRSHFVRLVTRLLIMCLSIFVGGQPFSVPLHAQETAEVNKAAQFTIKVLAGEDAVNIIKKKTAVKPVVEIRDKNDLPVAGASVVFATPQSGASAVFAHGARTLTVVTDSTGHAVVPSMSPVKVGVFHIKVTATSQNEIVSAVITQTNFTTIAAATAAGASVGAGVGAGGGAGISAVTIGLIAAGVVAGAIVGVKLGTGGGSNKPSGTIGAGSGPVIIGHP